MKGIQPGALARHKGRVVRVLVVSEHETHADAVIDPGFGEASYLVPAAELEPTELAMQEPTEATYWPKRLKGQ